MENQPKKIRYNHIDALRVMSVLLLIIFHTGLVFTPYFRYILRNDETSLFIGRYVVAFLHLWHMPLFFLLAGASAYFALGRRTGSLFLGERAKRILIPFLFGFLVLVPPQVYFDVLSRGSFTGSYIDFYPHFFEPQHLTWHHLWFILYLFTFSIVAFPLLLYLRTDSRRPLLKRIGGIIAKPGVIFLMPLPIALTEMLFRARWPGWYNLVDDWANFTMFLAVFLYGFIMFSDDRIMAAIRKQWGIAFGITIPATLILLMLTITETQARPALGYSDPLYYVYSAATAWIMWLWILGWLGLGDRLVRRRTRFLDYASRIAYPYYMFHQTVLSAIGFLVIQLNLGIAPKFALIAIPTLLLTALGCEVIRRVGILRFLFGMKVKRS